MLIPAIALRGINIFPGMVIQFDLTRKKTIMAVEYAIKNGGELFAVTQRDIDKEEPAVEDLYNIGVVVSLRQVTKINEQNVKVVVEGLYRAVICELDQEEKDFLQVEYIPLEEDDGRIAEDEEEEQALYRILADNLSEYIKYHPKVSPSLSFQMKSVNGYKELVNRIAMNLPISYEKRQLLLECKTTREMCELLIQILAEEANIASIKNDLNREIKEKVDKNQREYVLREQLGVIRKELNGDVESDADSFRKQLNDLKASTEIKDRIAKVIRRFETISDSSQEAFTQRSYIETLLELPWDEESQDNLDINNAKQVMDKYHYGMDKVKERILEFLAVRVMTMKNSTNSTSSPIICLVGPPGTGKTSIAKSVAEALNKEYVRICLGGVRDEAEIRGHRRTYVAAMPGRIAAGLKQAGVKNPLMLLDEIDKVSNDYKGDTFSALLEVLDPDQNRHFRDHYIELPLDLSKVLFIATANDSSLIPRPLLDRMEIIEVGGYTANEKFHIAKEHLTGKQLTDNGLTRKQLKISDGALKDIIEYYTREAGVRELERKIGELCRKATKELLENPEEEKISISSSNLTKYLKKRKYSNLMANKKDEVGICRGLAWTSVGGDTLQIEVSKMPGKGEIELTGRMGDVMRESASIAYSFVRSISPKYNIKPEAFTQCDLHLHIPEGAVPKDGPSAGITMATAMLSAMTEKKIYCKLAMTGEITLRGHVLPIGGLKEKLLAAKTAGILKVLVPKENEADVLELDEEIVDGMEIVYVSNMNQVIKEAFVE